MYLDEAGMDNNDVSNKGYAPKGERCYGFKLGHKTERISFIAAYCNHEVFAPMSFTGCCDRCLFEIWLRDFLIPNLKPGHTIIMDNASWHKRGNIAKMIHEAGCDILYLPPYSPDFNPIEKIWAKVKNIAQKWMDDFFSFHDAIDYALCKVSQN